ncbi:glycosyltransferase [Helicobacter sp. MIT 14-3879]|uniref:glycosyltransferase n=1 Tax=Helicobacter sp. MIT 14-3879 TaxID=2040649 RepID=UPI002163111B|nr:glycosyltransferase [Helicobacter sp. MIT 14-3879]
MSKTIGERELEDKTYSYAPVCIIAYNRVDKIKKTIECLAKNTLADKTDVYVFADAPKNDKAIKGVQEVREYLDSLKGLGFQSLHIIKAEKNLGILGSIMRYGELIFKQYDCFIGLEDDIQTHPYFLSYMNDALAYYRDNKQVMAVTAFTHQIANTKSKTLQNYPYDVLFSYAFHSWGWGMWRDRWEQIDWIHSDISWYVCNPKHWFRGAILSWFHLVAIRSSSSRGYTIGDLWDVHLSHILYRENKVCVWPSQFSYTRNFGFDGTGVHKFNFESGVVDFEFATPKEHLRFTNEINLSKWFHFKIGLRYAMVWSFGFVKMFKNKILKGIKNG